MAKYHRVYVCASIILKNSIILKCREIKLVYAVCWPNVIAIIINAMVFCRISSTSCRRMYIGIIFLLFAIPSLKELEGKKKVAHSTLTRWSRGSLRWIFQFESDDFYAMNSTGIADCRYNCPQGTVTSIYYIYIYRYRIRVVFFFNFQLFISYTLQNRFFSPTKEKFHENFSSQVGKKWYPK